MAEKPRDKCTQGDEKQEHSDEECGNRERIIVFDTLDDRHDFNLYGVRGGFCADDSGSSVVSPDEVHDLRGSVRRVA